MTKLSWTGPYHGVQHLKGDRRLDDARRDFQVTINIYGSFTTLLRWRRDRDNRLLPFGEPQMFDTPELARDAGETWFKKEIGV